MKLSLTFEPFVKPLYKQFCVQKIQQSVNQIKSHFKFSKKQSIYQSTTQNIHKPSPPLVKQKQAQQMNRTIKKQFTFQRQQEMQKIMKQTNQINFQHQLKEKQHKKQNTGCFALDDKQDKQELIEFMTKVENHSLFYKTLMEQTELLNKKTQYLERLIDELKSLKKDKQSKYNYQNNNSQRHYEQQDIPLYSMTFRNCQFQNQQYPKPSHVSNQIHTSSKQYHHNINDNQLLTSYLPSPKFTSPKKANHSSKNETQSYQNYLDELQNQNFPENQQDNCIYENADFIINFMKLEQEFNKIKKKTQFSNNYSTLSPNKSSSGLSCRSNITCAH